MDNACSHSSENLSNIKIVHLPPNMTSEFQSMDKVIAQAFKLLHLKSMLNCLITSVLRAVKMCMNSQNQSISKMLLTGLDMNWTK